MEVGWEAMPRGQASVGVSDAIKDGAYCSGHQQSYVVPE